MGAASKSDCLGDIIRRHKPDLKPFEQAYRQIHENAELSEQENSTAQHVASVLATLNFEVIRGIGGKGVVGILRNGKGQTVLLRAELDGLPIQEDTGLPYASKKRMADSWGRYQPTMHACGHDMHMACLMAAASLLNNAKTEWSGTLIALFQPNEEHTGGAKAMVEGGLYDRVPVPDIILGQHSGPFQAGNINIRGGPVLVSADTMHIKIYSSLGHPANPQINIDPVKLASNIIVQLDSLVDEIAGDQYAHAGVDEIHAGYPGQDWLSHVNLTLDIKAYDDAIRVSLLDRIGDLIREQSHKAGVKQLPEISVSARAPLTNNSQPHAAAIRQSFSHFFGNERLGDTLPKHPCEDFSRLAMAHNQPYVFWFFGREDGARLDDAVRNDKFLDQIPINHSPRNAPLLHPTLQTGMEAMALAALTFLAADADLGQPRAAM